MRFISWIKGLFAHKPVPEIDWGGTTFPEEFGNETSASPRLPPAGQDHEMSHKVARALFGDLDPLRKVKTIKVIVTYEDGSEQQIYERTGAAQAFVERAKNDIIRINPFEPEVA